MSGKAKRRDEAAASDAESEGHHPPTKIPKKDSDDDSDDIVVCEISKNRRVSVRNWQGRVVVDIREFYLKDGKKCPGKKGYIILTFLFDFIFRNYFVFLFFLCTFLTLVCEFIFSSVGVLFEE
ncbi:hypothetical protein V8G54_005757 [Vigna mungo]|uniref:Transcriptional coactivator p15 (PC4) C-terminal domain-containing protein n=1 Tax=Vigna mungo TaxID=3915 RepID=A0AAQ3NYI8_VIGMU